MGYQTKKMDSNTIFKAIEIVCGLFITSAFLGMFLMFVIGFVDGYVDAISGKEYDDKSESDIF